MSPISYFLLRCARWLAGEERREWVDAMEAEAVASGRPAIGWTAGCVWGAFHDRIFRERRFLIAILCVPMMAFIFNLLVFFATAPLFIHGWIPGSVSVGCALLSPLPFAFMLGKMRPGLWSMLAAGYCFFMFQLIPMLLFWIEFGKSPLIWFGDDATMYMMPPFQGLAAGLLVWLLGAWLGSRSRSFNRFTH